ncbi:MAG: ABC transporter permease [Deltaproteobacteria bacterium]|nr:ABC transporter permease [Candidatus Anaeroferrophillus wilburensis]MBN2889702.1 ABC transporter permease [Deltaproteobacteria bacterium]
MEATDHAPPWWHIEQKAGTVMLVISGAWQLANLNAIHRQIKHNTSVFATPQPVMVDGSGLSALDTAGALVMFQSLIKAGAERDHIKLTGFQQAHLHIATLVREHLPSTAPVTAPAALAPVELIGKSAISWFENLFRLISFLGQTTIEFWQILRRPANIRTKELVVQLQQACLEAIPIITLVTLLIGIVIAYLSAIQIKQYGANIFIVDGVGIAMCRELSPMIVAIVVAGRTGSSYTAQIGTMKLNEEIDALVTMGLSPMQVLVLPRVLALAIAMPLLVLIGDLAGIIGGMMIAGLHLEITSTTFITRLQEVISLKTFMVGISKAPIFAIFIAMIGCRMGLNVENNTLSIGLHTTSTVVQSIVSVILLDAVFAIICVELGI